MLKILQCDIIQVFVKNRPGIPHVDVHIAAMNKDFQGIIHMYVLLFDLGQIGHDRLIRTCCFYNMLIFVLLDRYNLGFAPF